MCWFSLYVVLRYVSHPEYKDFAGRLTNSLVNVRAIIHHFRPKIDRWSKENNLTTLTEEEVRRGQNCETGSSVSNYVAVLQFKIIALCRHSVQHLTCY